MNENNHSQFSTLHSPLIPPGYKQTEVGVIPEDWDAGPIGRAVERLEAGASVNSEKDEAPEFDSYPCVLKTGAATEGSFDPRESKKVARRDLWRLRVSLRKDTILVSRMNTVELVGESGYVDADYPNLFVPDRMWMTTIRSTGRVHPRWLSYILAWQPVKSQISASATGTSGSMKNISKPSFRAVEIPYPPMEEQRAIAEALNDADALIESLEQSIAKKRQIKQGAMQKLLTGKKRLPGFSGEWERLFVEDVIVRFFCGPSPTCEERNIIGDSEWGVLKTTAITWEGGWDWTKHKALPRSFWDQPQLEVKAGDVIVTKAGPRHRVGVTAWVDYVPRRIIVSGKMIGLRPDTAKAVPLMLASAIAAKEAQTFLDQRTTGMAESQVNFENAVLLRAPIRMPRIDEQSAIAAILSDMDAEIAALKVRLAKARQLKLGMMQELLTGRIRLPVDGRRATG